MTVSASGVLIGGTLIVGDQQPMSGRSSNCRTRPAGPALCAIAPTGQGE
jgi:hypothetical protein